MTWNAGTERGCGSTNTEGDNRTYSLNRPTAIQVDGGRSGCSREEIEACRRFVEPFGLPYYPDFEPYVRDLQRSAIGHFLRVIRVGPRRSDQCTRAAKRGSLRLHSRLPHTGRSAARLARLLREQEVPGSNPGAPISLR